MGNTHLFARRACASSQGPRSPENRVIGNFRVEVSQNTVGSSVGRIASELLTVRGGPGSPSCTCL
jgi:hypothetical protein